MKQTGFQVNKYADIYKSYDKFEECASILARLMQREIHGDTAVKT